MNRVRIYVSSSMLWEETNRQTVAFLAHDLLESGNNFIKQVANQLVSMARKLHRDHPREDRRDGRICRYLTLDLIRVN